MMMTINLLTSRATPHRLLPRLDWLLRSRPHPGRWRRLGQRWSLVPSVRQRVDRNVVSPGWIKRRTVARLKREDVDRAA